MTVDFTRLFVDVDDCWKAFEKMYAKHLIEDGTCKRNRKNNLSTSEIMTILIAFQTRAAIALSKISTITSLPIIAVIFPIWLVTTVLFI